ncbi:hypothetical protein [Kocuria sp.]|uniref:hypothetical protein n=1 Tax=Kocuria sp. TaxID=1871328 RepID=UPI0026DB936B|nr:hypothetical protein [Kocuria sp.]MDO4919643.1 hypothetical protein [Kocuria sp.]
MSSAAAPAPARGRHAAAVRSSASASRRRERRAGLAGALRATPGTRLDRALSGALLVLSALPYAAVPLGSNTNLPLSSVVSVVLVLRCARHMPVMWTALLVGAVPFFASAVRMFLTPEPLQIPGSITWLVFTLPFAGTAAAVMFLGPRAIAWLSWTVLLSAAFTLVQKYVFLDALGVIPFESLYSLPGYANVSDFSETFLTYVRRPFGLFPETSFMVGSLSLMAMALVVLVRHHRTTMTPRDVLSLALVLWAVAISGSGAAVVVLGVVMIAAVAPYAVRRAWAAVLIVPLGLAGAVFVGLGVLQDRQDSFNWSWADRGSSLTAGVRYLLSDPVTFLWGVGRGNTNALFLTGRMPLGDLQHYNPLPDIYSVIGRVLLESGMVFGLALMAWMAVLCLRSGGRNPLWLGACTLLVWLVVAGATTSYDSAFWVWGTAGLCLGLELTRGERATAAQDAPLPGTPPPPA